MRLAALTLSILSLAACLSPDADKVSLCNEVVANFQCVSDLTCDVPLTALTSTPRCFSGKTILSSGFVAHQDRETRLYLNEDAARQYFQDQSVRLDLIPNSKGWPTFKGPDRYLRVTGVVQLDPNGKVTLKVSRPGSIDSRAYKQ